MPCNRTICTLASTVLMLIDTRDQMVMPYGTVPEQTTVETVTNMTPENRAHYESEKEAIHLILDWNWDRRG
ncbi:hypothetical protein Tco_1515510 [Tanacetum coccineum]